MMTIEEIKYAALRRKPVKCHGISDRIRVTGLLWNVPEKGPARVLVVLKDSAGYEYKVQPWRIEPDEEDTVPETAAEYMLEVAAKAQLGINSSRDKSEFAVNCKTNA